MSERGNVDNTSGTGGLSWRTKAHHDVLLERALMLKNIRAFFDAKSVIEVETPLLSHHATTDPHLDSLQCRFRDQPCYLNTSPEYAMKRLLADWKKPIYQVCKAFRDDELGVNHNPEFTMLEWYQLDYEMQQLMDELAELVVLLCGLSTSASPVQVAFERLSYQQAFEKFAGINPHLVTAGECFRVAKAKNVEIPQGLGENQGVNDEVNDWLDWLLMQLVLPAFNKKSFTYLYDYPASQCALATIAESEPLSGGFSLPVARRFELFFGELELANGFFELTDAAEQLQRFEQENLVRKQLGKPVIAIDDNLIAALSHGLPVCSGVALGLDRLLMVLTGAECIEQVLSFSWQNS